MDQDQFEDIKVLVQTTANNTKTNLQKDLEPKIDNNLNRIERKIDDGLAGVGDAISNLSDHIDDKIR